MNYNILINKHERIDDLHRKGYKIIQNSKSFCFGIDAVILSNFVNLKKNQTLIDLGTGTGIIPILVEARTNGKYFIGIDIQKEIVEMAKRSINLNKLSHKILIEECDIKNAYNNYKNQHFDVVTSNPPYMKNNIGFKNKFTPKAIARHEILCNIDDVISNASKLLKTGGKFYMVHRPNRLSDIIITLTKYNLEPKKIRFVHSYKTDEPFIILIESIKDAKSSVKILPPLIVYNNNGKFTEELYKIYYE